MQLREALELRAPVWRDCRECWAWNLQGSRSAVQKSSERQVWLRSENWVL